MQIQRFGAVLIVAAIALTGCGGGNKTSNTSRTTRSTTAQYSPAAAAASPGAMQAAAPGAMEGRVAAVPSTLHCGAVQPVWVNPRSHVYHEPSDPLYGRTKHGEYMCPSQAVAAGYHAAGSRSSSRPYAKHHHRSSGAMAPASPAGAPASP